MKAKAQWDRYADLKQCSKVEVGVKLSGDGEGEGDWLEVGKLRSHNDEYTLIAIARQRALIAGKLNTFHNYLTHQEHQTHAIFRSCQAFVPS